MPHNLDHKLTIELFPSVFLLDLEALKVLELPPALKHLHPKRAYEILGLKRLLEQLHYSYADLTYTPYHQPLLEGKSISIAHTLFYLVVQITPLNQNCAIDIEALQERIFRLAPQFLHPQELDFKTQEALTLIWCVKEALYKHYSPHFLNFKQDICVQSIEKNTIFAQALGIKHELYYDSYQGHYIVVLK